MNPAVAGRDEGVQDFLTDLIELKRVGLEIDGTSGGMNPSEERLKVAVAVEIKLLQIGLGLRREPFRKMVDLALGFAFFAEPDELRARVEIPFAEIAPSVGLRRTVFPGLQNPCELLLARLHGLSPRLRRGRREQDMGQPGLI